MNKSNKIKTSNIVLIVAVIAVISYAVVAVAFQLFTQVEISSTLTACWFSFWGVEIAALATIKTSKVKHGVDVTYDENFEEITEHSFNETEEYNDEIIIE